jgi:hypothetical protein
MHHQQQTQGLASKKKVEWLDIECGYSTILTKLLIGMNINRSKKKTKSRGKLPTISINGKDESRRNRIGRILYSIQSNGET